MISYPHRYLIHGYLGESYSIQDKHTNPPRARHLCSYDITTTLWEVNDLSTSRANKDFNAEKVRSKKKETRKQKAANSLQLYLSDSSYSPVSESERMKGLEGEGCRRRASVASHKLQLADYYLGGFNDISNFNFNEVGNQPRNSPYGKGIVRLKNSLNKARTGLSTSKKLVKTLNQICLHEHHSSTLPLISALRSELDQFFNQISGQVLRFHRSLVQHVFSLIQISLKWLWLRDMYLEAALVYLFVYVFCIFLCFFWIL